MKANGSDGMRREGKRTICYLTESAGDWGGASRVLFTTLRLIDRTRFEPLVLLPSKGPGIAQLDEMAVPYVIWGRAHEPNRPIPYAVAVARAIREFRRRRVDLLHVNGTNYWRPAEVVAGKLLRIPIATHYHIVVDKPAPFIKYSDLIIAVSGFTSTASQPKSVNHAVVHNSVALARFDGARDIRGELGLTPQDVVVTFVGQVREIKGIDLFIKMAHAIRTPSPRFLIAGECRDPQRYPGSYTEARLREEIGGDARILYLGYRRDVENIYRASDIVVIPSRWGDPFPLVPLEVGASRRPVIATRDGGIPEAISHGDNGFLVERDDLDGLVRYATQLIEDQQLRRRMGERARAVVEERFTSRPVRELERVYESLLSR